MRRLSHALDLVVAVGRMTEQYDIKYPAAALAYYAFISLIPVLILSVSIISDRLVEQIRTTTPEFFTPGVRELLSEGLVTGSGRTGATVLAVAVLAWSGANMVIGFQTVVNRVEHRPREPLRIQLRNASSVLGSFGLLVVAVVLSSSLFAYLRIGGVLAFIEPFVQFGMLAAAFVPLYYAPSNVVTSLTEALPGALTAAFGWTVLLTVINYYAVNSSQYALYGVLSGVIIVLTSFYVGAIFLMIGVIVNTVTADTDDVGGRYRDTRSP